MRAKRVTHVGRESHKFRYVVCVHDVKGLATPAQGLPDGAAATVQISRGSKVVSTKAVEVSRGESSFEEELEFVCTLYASKKEAKSFSEKSFRVSVLLGPSSSKRPSEVAFCDLNVAEYASKESNFERRLHESIKLSARTPKAARGALASETGGLDLKASITTTFLKDLEVGDDDESISSINPQQQQQQQQQQRRSSAGGGGASSTSRHLSPPESGGVARTRDLYEQDLAGFERDIGLSGESDACSETSSVNDYADALALQHQAASMVASASTAQEKGAIVDSMQPAAAAALAHANSQLADLRQQLEEAKQGSSGGPGNLTAFEIAKYEI